MFRGFATINYWAEDLEAAKGWYSELLGIEPYFERVVGGSPAYEEFRVGDYQHELGLIDRRYEREAATAGPGGAALYWHVDDVEAALERLLSMGAREYEALTHRGEEGFITASVVDPSGTSWASCTTRTTWRFWLRPDKRDPHTRLLIHDRQGPRFWPA